LSRASASESNAGPQQVQPVTGRPMGLNVTAVGKHRLPGIHAGNRRS
jgi:hypothetical protein